MYVVESLEQEYTVFTVDQALFCKLMELKWHHPKLKNKLIPRMGAFHICLNFLKVIRDHMDGSGLKELLIESGVFGEGAASQVMSGKNYNKGVRAHKLVSQAIWREILPKLQEFISKEDPELAEFLLCKNDVTDLYDILCSPRFIRLLEIHTESMAREKVNYKFWTEYLHMVSLLLAQIRAQREGNWYLHIQSFRRMLPYFMIYDHYHYGRWGAVYLQEMQNLPKPVLSEFEA